MTDKQVREILADCIEEDAEGNLVPDFGQATKALTTLIADRERVARIDELEKMWAKEFELKQDEEGEYWYRGYENDDYIRNRITALSAPQVKEEI